ncbi:hypothetical protein [Flavobacterium proteolyticum]|uniref:Apea-like HEPN domain-containing protein n=1 Tax=Flavobacterium proteolyticum TaxID=2911683 RepID=A0ABR9WUA7_9FLAO|nr:hypothetical protein [Flavobacterium proteolyticum]MBE9577241.1 hypothetical protein [Flavobacterium proteolyticum]
MDAKIEKYKEIALKILSPIKSIDENTKAEKNFLFTAKRCPTTNRLPNYYLVYFLFADLLKYKDLGKFEKIAWSFPIEYNGKAFLIEYRKFGIGIFVNDIEKDQVEANEIVNKIIRAVKAVKLYYNYVAEEGVKKSEINVNNFNSDLFERFNYLKDLYKKQYSKYEKNKGKTTTKNLPNGGKVVSRLDYKFLKNSNHLAISTIEAFFSWTEHLFIHIAIIAQNISDGEKISKLIEAEWKTKFITAIPLSNKEESKFYNELLLVRQQMRNFVAHGAFGKNGNAFQFHSKTGAVPVLMSHDKTKNKYDFQGNLNFNDEEVIKLIENFIEYLWKSKYNTVMLYTQEHYLPTIVTLAKNGVYKEAVESIENMEEFIERLTNKLDDSANMDW